jgi:hypothetical protein
VKLHCIDPWEVYDEYDDIKVQRTLVMNYAFTRKRLKPYDCNIIRKTSMDAVKDFKPESLDFVYIDGNHRYEYVKDDIQEWSKIVKKGGVVSGHDYKYYRRGLKPIVGVGQAVDEYTKENNIDVLYLTPKNNDSSWFFIK